jgi:hypothetical protein
MMLATLHGKRNNSLGCSGCKGNCHSGTECTSLSPLGSWYSGITDTVSNIADAVTAPAKAVGSAVSDVATGDFSQALHDTVRAGASTIMIAPNLLLASTSNVPGIDKVYPYVMSLEANHPDAIVLAAAAIAAVVLSVGTATPAILPSLGLSSATVTSVSAATATAVSTVALGQKLLATGQLTPEQKGVVTQNLKNIQESSKTTTSSSGFSWMLLAPLLFLL